jgi:hypothetical protein
MQGGQQRQWWQCGGDGDGDGNGDGNGNGHGEDRDLKVCVWCGFDMVFCGVDKCFIIVIQLPLACGSRRRSFVSSFYYMRWEPVPMFFVVFVPDVFVELLVQHLRKLLGIHSTIVPCGDLVEL